MWVGCRVVPPPLYKPSKKLIMDTSGMLRMSSWY